MKLSEVPAKFEELMRLLREIKGILEEIRDGKRVMARGASVSVSMGEAERLASPSTPAPLPKARKAGP